MTFNHKNFHISIYGNGNYEYDGYYLVVVDEFDEWDYPTKRKVNLYIKAKSIDEIAEFINHVINEDLMNAFGNNEKLHIQKQWNVISKGK